MVYYNIGYYDGNIRMTTEVLDYTEADIPYIENDWEPTATKWVNQTYLDELAAIKLAEEKRKAEELAAALKRAADAKEKARVRAAAEKAAEIQRARQKVIDERLELTRIKAQEAQNADIKSIVVTQKEIVEPEGLYFNQ